MFSPFASSDQTALQRGDAATGAAACDSPSGQASSSAWIGDHWRIDSGHRLERSRGGAPAPVASPASVAPAAAVAPVAVCSAVSPQVAAVSPDSAFAVDGGQRETLDRSTLAIAHAENLIHRLQQMSEDLDMRSAKLNADIAMQERRERAFRLWAQHRCEELQQQRAANAAERQAMQQQARRLAFGGD